MRLSTIIVCLVVCGCGSSPVGPTKRDQGPESTGGTTLPGGGTAPAVIAVYTATLTAYAACAFVLEPEARERTYTEMLRSDGTIDWSGPTLNPPSGHATLSSGVLSDNTLSFSIDVERDPQSDGFNGLWEDLGSGKILNISGSGSGAVRGTEITGTFDGLFALYDPLDPPQPGTLFTGHYCKAKDHQFRMSVTRVLQIAIVTLSAACGQSPTLPTVPQPPVATVPSRPSPSPTPGGISGKWVGTFDTSDAADCATNTPASASFTQDADRVHGTLNAVDACGLAGGAFEGVLQAGNLRGALNVGELSGEATGTLSGDVLELQTTDLWDPTRHRLIPAGAMHLHHQ